MNILLYLIVGILLVICLELKDIVANTNRNSNIVVKTTSGRILLFTIFFWPLVLFSLIFIDESYENN